MPEVPAGQFWRLGRRFGVKPEDLTPSRKNKEETTIALAEPTRRSVTDLPELSK
ncbi:MAG: hypothetical protein PHE83_13825 [Opitutaceae bacterium]|nr:hypothetical protein [Opitutaceae bacterium]